MSTRREFFKHLTAATAGVALVPFTLSLLDLDKSIEVKAFDLDRPVTHQLFSGDRLSISQMQTAFGEASYGSQQPSLILMTKKGFIDLCNKLHPRYRWADPTRDFTNIIFMGAACAVGSRVPAGEVWFINEKYQHAKNLQAILQYAEVA